MDAITLKAAPVCQPCPPKQLCPAECIPVLTPAQPVPINDGAALMLCVAVLAVAGAWKAVRS